MRERQRQSNRPYYYLLFFRSRLLQQWLLISLLCSCSVNVNVVIVTTAAVQTITIKFNLTDGTYSTTVDTGSSNTDSANEIVGDDNSPTQRQRNRNLLNNCFDNNCNNLTLTNNGNSNESPCQMSSNQRHREHQSQNETETSEPGIIQNGLEFTHPDPTQITEEDYYYNKITSLLDSHPAILLRNLQLSSLNLTSLSTSISVWNTSSDHQYSFHVRECVCMNQTPAMRTVRPDEFLTGLFNKTIYCPIQYQSCFVPRTITGEPYCFNESNQTTLAKTALGPIIGILIIVQYFFFFTSKRYGVWAFSYILSILSFPCSTCSCKHNTGTRSNDHHDPSSTTLTTSWWDKYIINYILIHYPQYAYDMIRTNIQYEIFIQHNSTLRMERKKRMYQFLSTIRDYILCRRTTTTNNINTNTITTTSTFNTDNDNVTTNGFQVDNENHLTNLTEGRSNLDHTTNTNDDVEDVLTLATIPPSRTVKVEYNLPITRYRKRIVVSVDSTTSTNIFTEDVYNLSEKDKSIISQSDTSRVLVTTNNFSGHSSTVPLNTNCTSTSTPILSTKNEKCTNCDDDCCCVASHDNNEQQEQHVVPIFCAICHVDFEDGDRIGNLKCHHTFHVHCLKIWLNRRNVCPLCLCSNIATKRILIEEVRVEI